MLVFTEIALRRGTELLFENVSMTIHKDRKVGLIGANGAGKTSLFKFILGELDADHGDLEYPQSLRIAHLAQEVLASSEPALDYVLGGDHELMSVQTALRAAEEADRFNDIAGLHEKIDSLDGYTAKSRAEQLLVGLGFSQDTFLNPLSSFSGGWRIRLNLARTLMAPSDLLLLDEPTNHLDLDAILWLSTWIKNYQGSMLLISHDREFLDETVDSIAYLHHQQIELYTGNYSQFEAVKAARLAEQMSNYEKQQRDVAHMQDFVRRFRAKATKARQAQSRIKALERMELIAPAHIDSPFQFRIPPADKTSDPLLSLDHASLGYGEPVLNNIRLNLHPGDRIGLLGHNGAGKSTLIKTLSGELPLLAGEIHAGANLKVGYFSQHQVDDLDMQASSFLHLQRLDGKMREQEVRNYLGGFDFRGDKVHEPVETFSGGEKARLALALVAFAQPNLLLMDEPTNHLDMEMRQALTIALQEFEGAILLVSHDRHLLANTVDSFYLVEDNKIDVFDGDLESYRLKLLGENTARKSESESKTANRTESKIKSDEASVAAQVPATKVNHKQSRQIRTRIKTIEERIDRLKDKLEIVIAALSDNAIYEQSEVDNLQNLLRDQMGLKDEIETLEEEWFEKSEILEQS